MFAYTNTTHIFTILGLSLLVMLICTSCLKEETTESTDPIIPDPIELSETSVFGRILDSESKPVSGAEITAVSARQTPGVHSDEKGYFFIPAFENKGSTVVLRSDYPNTFQSYHSRAAEKEGMTHFEIAQTDRGEPRSFSAHEGGQIQFSDKALLEFPPHSAGDYEGLITVYAQWINPFSDTYYQQKIGGQFTLDEQGKEVSVQSLGMLLIEILDESGQPIVLEKEADLSIFIPDQYQAMVMNDLAGWYFFNDATAWIKNESLSVEGDYIRASVRNNSYWKFGYEQGEAFELSGRIVHEGQSLLPGGKLMITYSEAHLGSRKTQLNAGGYFSIADIPRGKDFRLDVFNVCGEAIYSLDREELSSNTDLGTIEVTESNPLILSIDARDCSGELPEPSYAMKNFGENHRILSLLNAPVQPWAIPSCLQMQTLTWHLIDGAGAPLTEPMTRDLNSEIDIELFRCFDPGLSLEVDIRLFTSSGGELYGNYHLLFDNPENQLILKPEVNEQNEITHISMSGQHECMQFELELIPDTPNQWLTKYLHLDCLGFDGEIDKSKMEITFYSTEYTGGSLAAEINIFDMVDSENGKKYDALIELSFAKE